MLVIGCFDYTIARVEGRKDILMRAAAHPATGTISSCHLRCVWRAVAKVLRHVGITLCMACGLVSILKDMRL